MKELLTLVIISSILFSSCRAEPTEAPAVSTVSSAQPNIILILSDDQRADDLASMTKLATLTEESTRFTKAYVTTPLCCPSRSSILSGQYAHNHGVLGNTDPYGFKAFKDSETIATWLQDAGYKTALIGKYLNGYANTKGEYIPPGWDTFLAFVKGPNYFKYTIENFVDGIDKGLLRYGSEEENYSTGILTQNAIDFLENTEVNDEQPFFLYFTPYAPHEPATPPEKYKNIAANIDPTSFPSYNEEDVSDKSTLVKDLPLISQEDQEKLENYGSLTAGALKDLDDGINKIIETLKSKNELENTVIIYMADNGLQWGEHRLVLTKNAPYEESIHVPMVIYDGRAPTGQTIDEFALNIDISPTLLDLAGLTIPDNVDGQSLTQLINGKKDAWRTSFLTEAWGNKREGENFTGVHQGQWSYFDFGSGQIELYDLNVDPYQLNNLAKDKKYSDELKMLQDELTRLKDCKGNECA